MMDYFRWLAFIKFRDFFEGGVCIPVFLLNLVIVAGLTALFWPLGIILITLSVVFWGFCVFLFAQRAWNANLAEYEKFKDRTK